MPIFLFSDIENSTALWEKHGSRMMAVLQQHDTILERIVTQFNGQLIKHTGDGIFAVFHETDHVLDCALAIQLHFQTVDWNENGELRIRLGLDGRPNSQEGIEYFTMEEDYFGPLINQTARIMNAGWGGQILLSPEVLNLAYLPIGAFIHDFGEHKLKGVSENQIIYGLNHHDLYYQDFPPLRTLSAQPNNLPIQPTPFCGRSNELSALDKLISDPDIRLVTIMGPGGMGKTRLALAVGEEQLVAKKSTPTGVESRFPNGVYFVSLAALMDSMQIVSAIAKAIDCPLQSDGRLPQQQLSDFLRQKQLLLILDNFDHLLYGTEEYEYNQKERSFGVSPHLLGRLRSTLLDCASFTTDQDLRMLFVDKRLYPWRNRLPSTDSPSNRVESVINFLHNQYDDVGNNALALLLHVLSEIHDPRDACHSRLTNLAIELEKENYNYTHFAAAKQKPRIISSSLNIASLELITNILNTTNDIKILVTSRERLKLQGEQLYPIQGLSYPHGENSSGIIDFQNALDHPAFQLFLQSAHRSDPNFTLQSKDLTTLSNICRLLAGMPLGLELAASWVDILPLNEIAAEIQRSIDFLGAESPNLPQRHQSIRACIDYSWQILTKQEKLIFAKLSVFEGGFTKEAAQVIAKANLSQLTKLVSKSMLQVGNEKERYLFHELIHQYGKEKLTDGKLLEKSYGNQFTEPEPKQKLRLSQFEAENSNLQLEIDQISEYLNIRELHCAYYLHYLSEQISEWRTSYHHGFISDLTVEAENIRASWQFLVERNNLVKVIPSLEYLWIFYKASGRLAESIQMFNQISSIISIQESDINLLLYAKCMRMLGEAHYALGQVEISRQYTDQALTLLDRPIPITAIKLFLGLFRQIARQTLHRLWLNRFFIRPATGQRRDILSELGEIYYLLANISYVSNEFWRGIYIVVRYLNLAEQIGSSPELAKAYAAMCFVTGFAPTLAEKYYNWAKNIAQDLDRSSAIIQVSLVTSLYKMGIGKWTEAEIGLEKTIEICEHQKRWQQWGESMSLLTFGTFVKGDFSRTNELANLLFDDAARRSSPLQQGWSLQAKGQISLITGEVSQAVNFLEEALSLLVYSKDRSTEIEVYGQLAIAYMKVGRLQEAYQAATLGVKSITQSIPIQFTLLFGYIGIAEVFIQGLKETWDVSNIVDEEVNWTQLAYQACNRLHIFRRIFPIGEPQAWLYCGRYNWLIGKPRKAVKAWHKGLEVAMSMRMPFQEGLIHYEIGSHLLSSHSDRVNHLEQAITLFSRLNVTHYLEQAQVERKNL